MEAIMYEYLLVTDEICTEDKVITINDYYNSRDICEYTIPFPETNPLNYSLVKDEVSSNEYYNVNYAL